MVAACENQLAQGCHKLLSSLDYSDMKFIVIPHTSPDSASASRSPDGLSGGGGEGGVSSGEEGVVIAAHRVIVAARCEYFKRALQSGMKEAIDKYVCVQVYCTVPFKHSIFSFHIPAAHRVEQGKVILLFKGFFLINIYVQKAVPCIYI